MYPTLAATVFMKGKAKFAGVAIIQWPVNSIYSLETFFATTINQLHCAF